MAPRRGGGGSSSGSSLPSCPNGFSEPISQARFAGTVIWFTAYLILSIVLCTFRKKTGAGKKLLGVPYILALVCTLVLYGCSLVSTVISECQIGDSYQTINWSYPLTIFVYLSYWLFLVVFVWTLNTMLRAQLGPVTGVFKVAYIAILALMGLLTCAVIVLECYSTSIFYTSESIRSYYLFEFQALKLRLSYYVLSLLAVLASGLSALATIMSLRSRRSPAGDLIGWVITLTITMIFWIVIEIVFAGNYIAGKGPLERETSLALNYLYHFARVLCFIFVMCIAKHSCWNRTAVADPSVGPDEYAGVTPSQYPYNGNADSQAYYYQQQSVHNGAVNVKA